MQPRYRRIHITGASGSGTTTLGGALAGELGVRHLDVDDFAWAPTEPPFMVRYEPEERSQMFMAAIDGVERWVLSGSLLRWGDELNPLFDLVVFLHIPEKVRIARLMARERARYGANIDPGGSQYESNQAFMAGARGYESGAYPVQNLINARAWLARQTCPVLQIEGAVSQAESVAAVLAASNEVPPASS
jgi:adenylate kinase family enzyme